MSHILKDEEKSFICFKSQALIQTLSHSRKIEYACDTCASQFTSRIMRSEPIHKHLTSGARECFQMLPWTNNSFPQLDCFNNSLRLIVPVHKMCLHLFYKSNMDDR